MRKYVITSVDPNKKAGGSKAKRDVSYFLNEKLGFQNFDLVLAKRNRPYYFAYMNFYVRHFFRQNRPQVVIFQYPNLSFYVMNKMVRLFRSYSPQGKIFFLIHDLMGAQIYQDSSVLRKEIQLLNSTDGLIVHNDFMKNYLKTHGVNVKMVCLEIFDYDNPVDLIVPSQEMRIAFPGNLGKSTFLKKIHTDIPIDLYGFNQAKEYPNNLIYHGFYPADIIASKLHDRFGLVWDGDSANSCTGKFGEYLKLNNPHKASLYISSGLPIITWNKAAIGSFVHKYQIGITVDSLNNLSDVLSTISDADYQKMLKNTETMAYKLRSGFFITSAVNKLLND